MNETIQSILGDLYALDPELKKSEKDLIPLIERLAESKLDLSLDEGFVTNLRNQLMVRADEMMEADKPATSNWLSRFLAPLMGGTVALAALMIGLMVWNGQVGIGPKPETAPAAAPMAIQNLATPKAEEPVADIPPSPIAKQVPLATKPQGNLTKKAPEAVEVPAAEPAPMMLQALPAEGGVDSTTSALGAIPTASDQKIGFGIPSQGNQTSIILAALSRAQAGERKITANSKQIGQRSTQEILGLNFDNLPDGFEEIKSILPAGFRAFQDQSATWSDGALEYYVYFENTYEWYGPFWSETQ